MKLEFDLPACVYDLSCPSVPPCQRSTWRRSNFRQSRPSWRRQGVARRSFRADCSLHGYRSFLQLCDPMALQGYTLESCFEPVLMAMVQCFLDGTGRTLNEIMPSILLLPSCKHVIRVSLSVINLGASSVSRSSWPPTGQTGLRPAEPAQHVLEIWPRPAHAAAVSRSGYSRTGVVGLA